jgi:hypothetical protein
MITVTEKDLASLENELQLALVNLSSRKLSSDQAKKLAKQAIKNIDFSSSSALAHKGVNWYAKELIEIIDFDAMAKY